MSNIKLDINDIFKFVDNEELNELKEKAVDCLNKLYNKTGKGNDYLGWINLPDELSETSLAEIELLSKKLQNEIDIVVVIGIGGSYLGTRAVQESLSHSFQHLKKKQNKPLILYAGQNIGEDYLFELKEILDNFRYGIVVISKSGTTTEPAIAFRILKEHLKNKVGNGKLKDLIVTITDKSKGALRNIADKEGYKSFIIPDDVGGRYSVLTPVGLVPLAIGGFNIRELVSGAIDMKKLTRPNIDFNSNPAALYAATRYLLYKKGKTVEILGNYDNRLHYVAEWWKQLYGESEGKEGLGIFPASVDLTTDLHSMGQYIQEGERILFETVLSIQNVKNQLLIPKQDDDNDNLNYLAGKRIDYVNKMAEQGTRMAHIEGKVPNIKIEIPELNEYFLGQLLFFFEIACGISGYLLGINPFDQPGVEAYKKKMFALLGKPS